MFAPPACHSRARLAAAVLCAPFWIACSGDDTSIVQAAEPKTADATTPATKDDAGWFASSDRPPGHWYVARESITSQDQKEQADALEGLGYASGTEDARAVTGVLQSEADLMQPGLNLYSSGDGPGAYLMESDGTVVHRWTVDVEETWPAKGSDFGFCRKARLLSGNRLAAVFAGWGVVVLDKDSNVLWQYDEPAHHDVCELEDGRIATLDRKAHVIPALHPTRVMVDDRLVIFSADGEVLHQISLLDSLLRSEFADRTMELVRGRIDQTLAEETAFREANKEKIAADPSFAAKLDAVGDFFHSNSLRVIGPEFAAANDGYEEGWFLISIRNVDLLVVLEVDEEAGTATARQFLEGSWRKQHEAIPLPTGRILMFDNRGYVTKKGRERARAIEIDPATGEVEWEVRSIDRRNLVSPVAGSVQRLANGNTMIIESTGGTAYEVTPDGDCVWKFVSPHRAGEDGEFTALLTDVIRVERESVTPLLASED